MDIKEWYKINKKRISILNVPGIYDRKKILNKVIRVSYNMYQDMNYSVDDLEFIPSLNLTEEQLEKWYDYIIQTSMENVLFMLEKKAKEEKVGLKRKSLLGGKK